MRTRAKANSTHARKVYIPKEEKRAPDTDAQHEQKKKVKTQPHEPTFAIEAPQPKAKAKAKTKTPEKDHEPKGPRGRPSNIQAITIPSEPEKKQETPPKGKEKNKNLHQRKNLYQKKKKQNQKQVPLKNKKRGRGNHQMIKDPKLNKLLEKVEIHPLHKLVFNNYTKFSKIHTISKQLMLTYLSVDVDF